MRATAHVLAILAWVCLLACKDPCMAASDNLPACDKAARLYKQGKLYDVLGVKKTASKRDIKRAFKKMSVKCHPDKDRGNDKADDNFIAITGAYETLSDDQERAFYDQGGSQGGPSSSAGHGQGFRGSTGHGGTGSRQYTWKPKDFQDINVDKVFKSFFSSGGSQGSNGGFRFSFGGPASGAGSSSDDTDETFARMFRGFNFGSRPRRPARSAQTRGQQGFGGFGGLGDLFGGGGGGSSFFGDAFSNLNKYDQDLNRMRSGVDDDLERLKRATGGKPSTSSKASGSNKASSSSSSAKKKGKAKTSSTNSKSTSRKARRKDDGKPRCRYHVKLGEICD